MDARETLGQVIRTRRQQLQLTQEQLAERVGDGVRQAEISRLERDRVALPRRRRLECLAAALEISLGELLVRTGWAGADTVFAVSPKITTPVAIAEPSAKRPAVAIDSSSRLVHLRAAIERSRELRTRTDHVLATSRLLAETWNGEPNQLSAAERQQR